MSDSYTFAAEIAAWSTLGGIAATALVLFVLGKI